MAVCGFMESWWWAVLLALGLAGLALRLFLRSSSGRLLFDTNVLRVPVLGRVIQKRQMALFARVLGVLLDNGVPVLQALRITADTLSNQLIAAAVHRAREQVAGGETLSEALSASAYFSPVVIRMLATGEESGRLGAVARRMAETFEHETERAVKTLTALFEPLMIVIMGVIIGFLVIAMLLPMLTLSANVT